MAAGGCFWPNMSHRTVMRLKAVRGPGNIDGLARPAAHRKGMIRPGTWIYPTQPIRKQIVTLPGKGQAA